MFKITPVQEPVHSKDMGPAGQLPGVLGFSLKDPKARICSVVVLCPNIFDLIGLTGQIQR